jgi:hypothetical protein
MKRPERPCRPLPPAPDFWSFLKGALFMLAASGAFLYLRSLMSNPLISLDCFLC